MVQWHGYVRHGDLHQPRWGYWPKSSGSAERRTGGMEGQKSMKFYVGVADDVLAALAAATRTH